MQSNAVIGCISIYVFGQVDFNTNAKMCGKWSARKERGSVVRTYGQMKHPDGLKRPTMNKVQYVPAKTKKKIYLKTFIMLLKIVCNVKRLKVMD